MQSHHPAFMSCILTLTCILLISGASAAPVIQASVGDIIPLSGYSYGSQNVYLFLTGPNLPVNGVALNDISKRADQGGFTVVQVDGNDHWSYKWGTANIGGRLDEGTYTIWVVNGPNDRSHLSQADYSTIAVTLGKPSISIDTPRQSGSMDLRSVPDGASVMMGEKYQGKTPLTISDLAPGTYDVVFSQFGYQKFSTRVPVEAGRITEVTATLVPDTGAIAITSVPVGATVLVDGKNTGVAPVTAGNLTLGNHTVAVSLDGYTSVQQTVEVIPGQIQPVTIGLFPVPLQKTETTHAAGTAAAPQIAGFVAILLLIQYIRRK
ncbi:MAG: PEGA domain-containing protein [Methanoregula sp.]